MILSRKQSHLYFRNKGLPVLIIIAKYVETSPMSINGWVEKQNVVHSYNDKWFSLKKKGKSDTCYTMGELWGHYAKWGKPVTKGRALHDPTYTYTRSPELSNSCQTSCWCLVAKSCLTFLWPHGLWSTRLLCPWDLPGKNTEMGCHALLQGIFPTQGSNLRLLCLLRCRRILYHWATREAQNSKRKEDSGYQVLGEGMESQCRWGQSYRWAGWKFWWWMVLTVTHLWTPVMTLNYILKKA